jgi:hypothetical protein
MAMELLRYENETAESFSPELDVDQVLSPSRRHLILDVEFSIFLGL